MGTLWEGTRHLIEVKQQKRPPWDFDYWLPNKGGHFMRVRRWPLKRDSTILVEKLCPIRRLCPPHRVAREHIIC